MGSLAAVLTPVRRAQRTGPAESVRDTAWFSTLYENSVDSVYRYAQVLVRDPDRAEDVTAEVFLRAWRGRAGLRDEASALSWLLTIAHNSSMTLLRSTREVSDIDAIAEAEDERADPAAEVFAELEASRIHAALRELTPEQQQVILFRFFEGLPHEEVAQRLGSNANAVRAIQFRAISRLRKILQEDPGARAI
jgi:RNA polymerase sigma-70 factor (ECF subfamily)